MKQHKTTGVYFDLGKIFADLNWRFFAHSIEANIKWGIRRQLRSKRSIRLGSYHPDKKTIIIHPCLDQAMVPLICVERILFHEMLHQHLPIKKSPTGKNLAHYPEFYEFEKKYPYLKEADLWLKGNLPRLLSF
jgi:hypothetical protein